MTSPAYSLVSYVALTAAATDFLQNSKGSSSWAISRPGFSFSSWGMRSPCIPRCFQLNLSGPLLLRAAGQPQSYLILSGTHLVSGCLRESAFVIFGQILSFYWLTALFNACFAWFPIKTGWFKLWSYLSKVVIRVIRVRQLIHITRCIVLHLYLLAWWGRLLENLLADQIAIRKQRLLHLIGLFNTSERLVCNWIVIIRVLVNLSQERV